MPQGQVEAGVEYFFQPTAVDENGDALTFDAAMLPHWASFDPATGVIRGIPSGDDEGEYAGIVISVSDGSDSAALDPFSITVVPAPPSWSSRDVGAVDAAGALYLAGSEFTLHGSGKDIWGTRDEFHFAYREYSGNVEIVARVLGVDNTNPRAKAGIMIRENLEDDSLFADVVVTPEFGADMHYRRPSPTWVKPGDSYDGTTTAPAWIRLSRVGDTFTGYKSADGTNWVVEDETTIPMEATVYVGLAATSRNDGVLTEAVFDDVTVGAPARPPQDMTPPDVPANVRANATSPTRIVVRWTESADAGSGLAGYRVYRDGELAGSTADTRLAVTGLAPNTTYSFTVSAYDLAVPANESPRSEPVITTTGAETWIDVPDVVGLRLAGAEEILDGSGLAVGDVDSRRSETISKGTVMDQSPAAGSPVAAGTTIDLVVSAGMPVSDLDAPTVPAGVGADAEGPNSVTVRWQASSDAGSGIGGYRVYRDGEFVGSTSGTRYSARSLDPATTYAFSVAAFDNASPPNVSAQSAPAEVATPGVTGSVTLSWQAPTQNTDGSNLTNLAGFVIYLGRGSGDYSRTIEVDGPDRTSRTVHDLDAGTWYFAMTAINSAGVESERSEEASIQVR